MKPGPFTYHDPRTVDDLMALLPGLDNARLLAGGQSLMPMLNMRYAMPDHVVDLNPVTGLSGVLEDGDSIMIGAMTRQSSLMASELLAAPFPIIAEALAEVGHFQTRNRGTIGGSLCHLDPSAELACIAVALDAVLTVRGPDGNRDVKMKDWPVGYMTPDIAADEVLTEIRLPLASSLRGQAFVEFARRHGDFAVVGVAALLDLEGDRIQRAAIAVGGASAVPVRLTALEAGLQGRVADPETFGEAAAEASGIEAMDDAYVSAGYRRRLTGVLVGRALERAAQRAAKAG